MCGAVLRIHTAITEVYEEACRVHTANPRLFKVVCRVERVPAAIPEYVQQYVEFRSFILLLQDFVK